jgi:predicted Zn-dependent protease
MSKFDPYLPKIDLAPEEALQQLDRELDQLTSTHMGRRAFLGALPLLLAACASAPKTRYREGDNSGQETALTIADEKKMTQEVLPQMKKDYPAYKNPEAQAYISDLGQKIVKANNLAGNPYQYNFTLVDVNYVNAFALPAGEIMVTAPLLAMAETESELAGVIGHEVGHVTARHTAERMDVAKKQEKKTWLYAIGGGLIGGIGGFAAGKLLCKTTDPKYKECMARAAAYGTAAGVGGGLLVQKYAFMANSREDEMEADRVGFRTSVNAGFSKDHVGLFYEKLLKMEEQNKGKQNAFMTTLSDALSTHPPSKERVKQMNEMSDSATQKPNAIVSSKKFDAVKKLIAKK